MTTLLKKNSLTLDLKKIPKYADWKGDWKYSIDTKIIDIILNYDGVDKFGEPLISQQAKSNFKNNIVDKLRNGVLHIKWSARNGGYGRRYSDGTDLKTKSGCNLGVHKKIIKNTIFKFLGWVDYDMVKGHPTILSEIYKNIGKGKLHVIDEYIQNFDAIAEEMIEFHSVKYEDDERRTRRNRLTKGDIKYLFNLTIYGGGMETWEKNMLDGVKSDFPKDIRNVPHPFYTRFRNEIQEIINAVYYANDEFSKIILKDCGDIDEWKKKGKVMSYFCGVIENHILCEAYNYGVSASLFPERSGDLAYDGFTMPPPPLGTDMEFHISQMNEYIFKKTGLAVKMKIKEFEGACDAIIEKRNSETLVVPVAEIVDADVVNVEQNDSYSKWVIEFEKEWCKIINTSTFIRTYYEDGVFKKFEFKNKKDLVVAYEHQCYTKYDPEKRKDVKIKFINQWLDDPDMLCYEDTGVFPPPLVCPPNVFNLWINSPYESQPFLGENDPEIDNDAVQKFVSHIDIICNRDPIIRDWVISWFAHSLQKPYEKPEHSLNFIGQQGTGKSTIFNTFGKLYGSKKVLETQTPERDCWGSFNSAMASAYLVILSETDKKNSFGADGKIKALITDYPMWINPKGKDQFEITSYHRVVQLTNTYDPVKTSKDDRRNVIIRCNDELKGNTKYFVDLKDALNRPHALRSIYWSFKNYDISDWNFRAIPKTEYHNKIIEHTDNPINTFLEEFTLQNFNVETIEIVGNDLLCKFREWKEKGGYKFCEGIDVKTLVKKIEIECNLPPMAFTRGARTPNGFKRRFDIVLLKKHFGLGCLMLNGNDEFIDVSEK